MISFHIEGTTCLSCAEHVREALEKVPGVRSASVSYPQRQAEIEASVGTTVDVTSLVAAVSALGYRAQAVDALRKKYEFTDAASTKRVSNVWLEGANGRHFFAK